MHTDWKKVRISHQICRNVRCFCFRRTKRLNIGGLDGKEKSWKNHDLAPSNIHNINRSANMNIDHHEPPRDFQVQEFIHISCNSYILPTIMVQPWLKQIHKVNEHAGGWSLDKTLKYALVKFYDNRHGWKSTTSVYIARVYDSRYEWKIG